jgi:hypothetical protein
MSEEQDASRRKFVKRAAYVAPAIVTLAAAPSYAKAGSQKQYGQDKDDNGKGQEPKPKVKVGK